MRNARLTLLVVISAAILLSGIFAVYYLTNRHPAALQAAGDQIAAQMAAQPAAKTPAQTPENQPKSEENPFVPAQNQPAAPTETVQAVQILTRLLLAVILSAILAFRPRKNVPLFRRNLYVAQTQILLAVVAAALMLIVGDNTARAFAIFAAVSLVRFRTNIRDPKEITVLLISLALGLATGVGRWDLGLILCLFALALLWVLEFNETEQVFRSMELTVKTHNTDLTQASLKRIFDKYKIAGEVRQIDPPENEEAVGCIMYYLSLPLNLSTDYLSDRIFALDKESVEGIEWAQKKGDASIYQ